MEAFIDDDNVVLLNGFISISYETFINELKDFTVYYGTGGNVTYLRHKMKYSEFIENEMYYGNQKYVFQNVLENNQMFDIITSMIPLPFTNKKLRISRLYTGAQGSGTNLHKHSVAINYLVYGEKFWIIFPSTNKNDKYVENRKFTYNNVEETTFEWYNKNKLDIERNVEELQIIIQKTGDVLLIPDSFYHAVINLDKVFGITYSWY